jgi:hypothetical protein
VGICTHGDARMLEVRIFPSLTFTKNNNST